MSPVSASVPLVHQAPPTRPASDFPATPAACRWSWYVDRVLASAQQAGPRRILLVEDDFDIRAMLALALEMEGFEVATAANGREALEELRAGRAPELILLDLMMPIMNGWEFRNAQRADPALAQIPIVILSGDGNVVEKTAALGAAAYIRKPLDLDELHATVRSLRPPAT